MKFNFKLTIKIVTVSTLVFLFQACSVKVPVNSPKASKNEFNKTNNLTKINIEFRNNLGNNSEIGEGRLKDIFVIEHDNKKFDSYNFAKVNLQNELKARGIPMQFVDNSDNKLHLNNFKVLTYRSSSFSPLVTISTMQLELKKDNKTKVFNAMVKRGKVPIWSIDEVFEPCYNQPTSLLIKEISAKINKELFGYKLSDKKVDDLIKKIQKSIKNNNNPLVYLDVYELGFSNNPKGLNALIAFSNQSDEYVRLAAISGLGMIGGENEFTNLLTKYNNSKLWQDRGMALKSIGDIGTKKTIKFLKEEKNRWQNTKSLEATWNLKIIDLYI